MVVPDVNLLVKAHILWAAKHAEARKWWVDLLNGAELVGLPWVTLAGFVRVATNRKIWLEPLTIEEAFTATDSWLASPRVQMVEAGPRHYQIFRELLKGTGGGNLVTDAHLAAIAIEHNAEMHSNDTDFGRFSGLKWVNPLK